MRHASRTMIAVVGVCLLCHATPSRAESLITDWSRVVVEAVIQNAPPPTVGTHVMSTVFTCAYEAWAAYDPVALGVYTGESLKVANGSAQDKETAIFYAIYHALSSWMPGSQADYDQFMALHGRDPNDASLAAQLGRTAAQAVLDARMDDGANRAGGYADTTGYTPRDPSNSDAWQPVEHNGLRQNPLSPHWGRVKAFAVTDPIDFRPPAPAAPGSQLWEAQIEEVLVYSANLTDRHKAIAEYWRPLRGTPPMLMAGLAADVSRLQGYGLDDDVKLFFTIHNAMFDAGICCWEAKYYYDYVRPITAIRNLGARTVRAWGGAGQGTVEMPASNWHPYQSRENVNAPTPPFPEYTSGHSSFSNAWARVMERYTGGFVFGASAEIHDLFIDQRTLDTPVVLYWPTFKSAAEEAGISRLYGGIHFSDGNLRGQEMGTAIGDAVWRKAQEYFNGGPHRLRVDLTGDGKVDKDDLLTLMRYWQQEVPAATLR